MHFNDVITARHSCRHFDTARKPSLSVLTDLCREALTAPSACNSQPWKILLISSPEALQKAKAAFHAPFVRDAAAIAVLCETEAELKPFVIERLGDSQFFAEYDLGILTGCLTLAAADHGVGSCIIGMFDQDLLKSEFSLPEGVRPRLAVALGYESPDATVPTRVRKPIDDTLTVL